MTVLLHATQLCVIVFMCAVTKNLWNAYSVIRQYGHAPARARRMYLREFYAMAILAVVASLLSLLSILVVEGSR